MDFSETCATGYLFSFNGQERTDKIYVESNLNTANFGEYDTRLSRRWNLDPKPQINLSDYSEFGCNPMMYTQVTKRNIPMK